MHRTHRRKADQKEAIETKLSNRPFKENERRRRAARMLDKVRVGKPPYSPAVMSWLSRELNKPARKITPGDIKSLLN